MSSPDQSISALLKGEDIIKWLVRSLRESPEFLKDYGYDLYLPNAIRQWINENKSSLPQTGNSSNIVDYYLWNVPAVSAIFYASAWELCRLGIVRPGVKHYQAQSTQDGSAGNGYSLTPFGKQWLDESKDNDEVYIPTEPGRFSAMIAPYTDLFGQGFKQRANEAIRCYGAHAYLACCVMCGAAAESVLLKLAIEKKKDEGAVLKEYRRSNGRKKIEGMVLRQLKGINKSEFEAYFGLLKYWRDESAHGQASEIKESEAFTSLALLLRCAQYAKDNYTALTFVTR